VRLTAVHFVPLQELGASAIHSAEASMGVTAVTWTDENVHRPASVSVSVNELPEPTTEALRESPCATGWLAVSRGTIASG